MSDLQKYGQTSVNRGRANSSASVSTITSQSSDFNINVNTSNAGTTLDYDIKSILPASADVQRLDIALYGSTGETPMKFLSTSGNLLGRLIADAKYKNFELQVTAVYLAPDIIPQGKIAQRFSLNLGLKKSLQKGKGELFFNANDLFNTMVIKRRIQGNGFSYTSDDYYETQVIRLGYSYKF